MKVLHVIDKLDVGGAEKVLVTLSNVFHTRGEQVSVLTIVAPGSLQKQLHPEIPFLNLDRKWKFNPVKMRQLIRIAEQFDIIHVHSRHNLRYMYVAARIYGLSKPLVFHEHFGNIEIDQSVKWHQKIILPSTWFIGVSSKHCQWAIERVGVPSSRVFLLHNVVAQEAVNEKKILKNDCLRIISVGNIRRQKNHEHTISVLAALNQKKAAHLLIVGKIVDEEYFLELKRLVQHLKLENQVCFNNEIDNIQPHLAYYHIALHSAHSESGPLVLIEYLAQGIPFLSYDVGEIAKITKNQFPDFFIDNLSIDKWVSRVLYLFDRCDSEEQRFEMRRFYEQNYSEEAYYQKCKKIYKTVLNF